MSQNRDRNSQKMAKMASSDFKSKKRMFNLTFFIDKNNAYTLIRVCWIRFYNQFWHNSAHNASKLALKLGKSTNLIFLIFDEQSKRVEIQNFQIFFEQTFTHKSKLLWYIFHASNQFSSSEKKKKYGRSHFCHFSRISIAILGHLV